LSANAYANFSQQVTLAATQTRKVGQSFVATAKNAEVISDSILGMMTQFPASAEDMATAAYDIYSSIDVSFSAGQKLLREFNKVAVAGGVDLKTATSAAISVLENFDTTLVRTGKTTKDTYGILNRMFAIVRYGRMNFAQFNDMLNSVVPAATGAQQSFDDVAGAMAFLTRRIPSQSRAATALARLLDVFTNRDFINGMRKAGVAIEDASGKLLPLPQIIDRIAALNPKRLNDVIQILTAVGRGTGRGREFTVQARRALIQLASGAEEYRRVQASVVADNDEFTNSFKAMSQTLGVRWQVFMNQLKVLILYIGEQALPVFLRIGDTIAGWIKHWNGLSDSTRGMIVRFGVLVSVASLISGVLLSIGGVFIGLAATIGGMSKTFGGEGVSNSLLGRMFLFLKTMRGIASLGLITVGIQLIRKGGNWETLGTILTAAGIGGIFGGRRGAGAGAAIAIGVELQRKGGEWGSVLGTIMQAAVAGGLIGGAPGAVGAGGLAIAVELWVNFNPQGISTAEARFEQFQKRVTNATTGWASALRTLGLQPNEAAAIAGKAWTVFERVNSKRGFIAGRAAAKRYIEGYIQKLYSDPEAMSRVPRGAKLTEMSTQLQQAFKILGITIDNLKPDKKMTLREALRSAKSFTELMDIANSQLTEAESNATRMGAAIARAFATGKIVKANKLLDAYMKSAQQKLTPENFSKLLVKAFETGGPEAAGQLLDQYVQMMAQMASEWENYQKQLVDVAQSANDQILDSLRAMYTQMQSENEQAFGQLFKGPWLTSETFDLAKEWGIQPRIQDLIKDLHEQNAAFARWRTSLAKLGKKGLPPGFLAELRQMGPEAQPLLDQILSAKPGQVNKLIAEWKQKNKQIQNATKMDFKDEIARFRAAGVKMGDAIVNGFKSAEVAKWFDTWVKKTFPEVISAAVNQAVAKWKAENPAPKQPPVRPPAGSTPKNKGGVGTQPSSHTQTNTDRSKNATVNVYMGEGAQNAADMAKQQAAVRQVAFIAQNVVRGWL
jgi:TP901 family phage tail tape measure protein